ncbi:MAG: cytochrome c biogenesis protein CcsA [Pseudomonadales bacterium]|nr:cytochrome c biogenesis protein CcsA [Pseudomonadales bacterium]
MKSLVQFFFKLGSPNWFYKVSSYLVPVFALLSIGLMSWGLVAGLLYAPMDFKQGNSYRIIYIHVPSSFIALSCYYMMALLAAVYLIWRTKMAAIVLRSCAVIGAAMTFIALVTGAIWGKPTWGTWWVWDARVTSMLVLFFIYMGIFALSKAYEREELGSKAAAILALVGTVNIPIIYWSVDWWFALHQGATLKLTEKSAMDSAMLFPLLVMIAATYCLYVLLILLHSRAEIIRSEQRKQWVKDLVK